MRALSLLFLLIIVFGCKEQDFNPQWTVEQAPPKFSARFETTKGDFDIEVTRNLSPKAADRLYQLIKHGYFDNGIFYRVVPGFVAQFGNTDTLMMNQWRKVRIPDEPVRQSNTRGTISFASSGKDSRDLELFINLKDNATLDTININGVKGFPSFAKVTKGMETVDHLYSGYGEQTMNDANLYLNRPVFYQAFPKLDLIRKASLIDGN